MPPENNNLTPKIAPKPNQLPYIIISSVAILSSLGLGAWGIMSNNELNNYKNSTNAKKEIKPETQNQQNSDKPKANKPGDSKDNPTYNFDENTIYISSWGIKIKLSDKITAVSYALHQKPNPSLCLSGHIKEINYFPKYADLEKSAPGLACLSRYHKNDPKLSSGQPLGKLVFEHQDYKYYATRTQITYSETKAEQSHEIKAIEAINEILTKNISTL